MVNGETEEPEISATATPANEPGPFYDLSVDPTVQALNSERLDHLAVSLRELIAHRIDGINYAESRRAQLAAIGGAIAAVGVALLPLGSASEWMPLRAAYIALSVLSLIVGVVMWTIFAWQTNYDYSFKTELNTWKWFYHQALPNKKQFGPGLLSNRGKRRKQSEQAAYSEQWITFKQQVAGLSNPAIDATQDMKQLFQLHVNERYKNHFLNQLRGTLVWGLRAIVIGTLTAFLMGLLFTPSKPTSSAVTQNGIEIRAAWEETGAVRDSGLSARDVEFRVSVRVRNLQKETFTGTTLVARDESGDAIPADFQVRPSGIASLSEGAVIDFSGYFWLSSSERDALQKITFK